MIKLVQERRNAMELEQYMPFIWIGFAVIMAICEAFTTQLVSLWFVLGSVSAAIVSIFTKSIPIQSAVFPSGCSCSPIASGKVPQA